jgi:hypothetical protein
MKLKPCPFCGCKEVILSGNNKLYDTRECMCRDCGANAHYGFWNIREKPESAYNLIRHLLIRNGVIEKYKNGQENDYKVLTEFIAVHTEQEAIKIMQQIDKELKDE